MFNKKLFIYIFLIFCNFQIKNIFAETQSNVSSNTSTSNTLLQNCPVEDRLVQGCIKNCMADGNSEEVCKKEPVCLGCCKYSYAPKPPMLDDGQGCPGACRRDMGWGTSNYDKDKCSKCKWCCPVLTPQWGKDGYIGFCNAKTPIQRGPSGHRALDLLAAARTHIDSMPADLLFKQRDCEYKLLECLKSSMSQSCLKDGEQCVADAMK